MEMSCTTSAMQLAVSRPTEEVRAHEALTCATRALETPKLSRSRAGRCSYAGKKI